MTVKAMPYPLGGGLDLVTSPMVIPPGKATAGLNYEPHPRGYQRVDGFERFDGRPKPSEATYYILNYYDAVGGALSTVGYSISGETSLSVGLIIAAGEHDSGSGFCVIKITGDALFEEDENIYLFDLGINYAKAGSIVERGSQDPSDDLNYLGISAQISRDDIEEVPGEGPVRGVVFWRDTVYAFRDNIGQTACVIYQSTPTGWQWVNPGIEIVFRNGSSEIFEGDTILGSVSLAEGEVKRVVVTDGSWSGGDAQGSFFIAQDNPTPFQQNEGIETISGGLAVADQDQSQTVLPPGGRYEFIVHNFYGSAGSDRIYGVNGVGTAFELGDVLTPIRTGMEDDRPNHIAENSNHLFLSFPKGSIQHSSTGEPLIFEVLTGSAEFGFGQEVNGMLSSTSGTLTIFGERKISVLYGFDAETWELRDLSEGAGADPWSMQMIGAPIYKDSVGVRAMNASDQFGDFSIGSLTTMIEPLFRDKTRQGIKPAASIRVRNKDQYRLYFQDNTGVTIYFGRQPVEMMPLDLGFSPTCTVSEKDSGGREVLFAGSENGFVYQLDSGPSFDGNPVPAYIQFPFNNIGSPAYNKRFTKVLLEVDSSPGTRISMVCQFDYAHPESAPSQEIEFLLNGGGGIWDISNWDQFYWSSPVLGIAETHVDGFGKNMSILAFSNETNERPHVIHGAIINFTERGISK